VGFVDREPVYTSCDAGDEWAYPVSVYGTPGSLHSYELTDGRSTIARFLLTSGDSWDRDVKLPPGATEDDVACFQARVVDAAGRASPWTDPVCPAGSAGAAGAGAYGKGCASAGSPWPASALLGLVAVGLRRRTAGRGRGAR
jgi:hypothetical protein